MPHPIAEAGVPGNAPDAFRAGTEGLVAFVKSARALRARFLDPEFFGEPAWDILLDVYQADLEQVRLKVSSVASGSGVPTTTVIRWLVALEVNGMIQRRPDPGDRRRVYISLSRKGRARMDSLFDELRFRCSNQGRL